MKRFLSKCLPVVIAICFGVRAYANDYKKETKLIPGVVFKSDKKIKDNIPSGMGILILTEKGGFAPWPAISIEGNFSGDTIYNGKAKDLFFLRLNATGTFTYCIEYDKQNKTTRLDLKQIDGLLNGCPVKDVPVITYIEDKNLHLSSIKIASSSFITPMIGQEFETLAKSSDERGEKQRFAESFYTMRTFPNTPIKSITYSIAVEGDGDFVRERFTRERNEIRFNFSPRYVTTPDDVNIIMQVNPEPEFYIGDLQNPKAYCKLKYNHNDLEKMVVQTSDGKATITLQESNRKDSYSDAINKWNIKFSDGNVYSGSLNGTGNLSPLLSYKKPDCESFLNMMVALSKIKVTEIPLYDGTLTFANGKTENYNKGVSDTQLATTLKQEPVVINLDAPGILLSVISPSELEKTTSLTVSGSMNKDDAKVLTELGKNISHLNLQNCLIINSDDGTGEIPMYFMKDRPRLKSVIFPKNLKSIADFAFQNCTSLEEVILPQSLKYMDNKLWAGEDGTPFKGCTSLKKIVFNGSILNNKFILPESIASSLKEIRFAGTNDRSAFGYYHGISGTVRNAKVFIPASIESDFGGTFENCEIYFESQKAPESTSYLKLQNCTIYIPKGSTTSYYSRFGNMNFIESDYPQFTLVSDHQPKRLTQEINLSLDLFQKLMNMKPTAVAQYLKQQGCKVEQNGEGVYEVKVKNGGITIFYPNYHSPRRGVGPVEFYTSDRTIYQQWVKSLQNADYTYFRDDIWIGDNAHKPEFGVMNNIGDKMDGADYSGTATLFLSAYPM